MAEPRRPSAAARAAARARQVGALRPSEKPGAVATIGEVTYIGCVPPGLRQPLPDGVHWIDEFFDAVASDPGVVMLRTVTDPARLREAPVEPEDWRRCPVERIDLQEPLGATQPNAIRLRGDRRKRDEDGYDRIWVLRSPRMKWIIDGHHRVAAALMAGENSIEAYVYDVS